MLIKVVYNLNEQYLSKRNETKQAMHDYSRTRNLNKNVLESMEENPYQTMYRLNVGKLGGKLWIKPGGRSEQNIHGGNVEPVDGEALRMARVMKFTTESGRGLIQSCEI